jgi:hypothetical protein
VAKKKEITPTYKTKIEFNITMAILQEHKTEINMDEPSIMTTKAAEDFMETHQTTTAAIDSAGEDWLMEYDVDGKLRLASLRSICPDSLHNECDAHLAPSPSISLFKKQTCYQCFNRIPSR